MTDPAELAGRARRLVVPGRRVILGITGPPGAGKSTLAAGLVDALRQSTPSTQPQRFTYVPMDGFHLADVELDRLGLRDRKGAPETFDAAGYIHTLQRIRCETDRHVYVPAFEREIEQPIAGAIPVPPLDRAGDHRRELPAVRRRRVAAGTRAAGRGLVRRR